MHKLTSQLLSLESCDDFQRQEMQMIDSQTEHTDNLCVMCAA